MRRCLSWVILAILPAMFLLMGSGAAVSADAQLKEFYRDRTIRIVVGFSPGGGFDIYSRVIARHLARHIPGNPSVIVVNMPGAGSLVAANHVYNVAPKDGTVIGNFNGLLINQRVIIGNPAVKFEPLRFNWLGAPTPDTVACAVRKESGFATMEEAFERDLILGAMAPGTLLRDAPVVLRDALGLKIKLIEGYKGTADIRGAADRGEVHGGCWGWDSISVMWQNELKTGDVIVLGQGGVGRHPDLKNVPHFLDLAKTDEARMLIEAGLMTPTQVLRAYALPPEVPEARVEALRRAFLATLKDPAFAAEAGKANLVIDPVPAESFYERIKALENLPPELRARLRNVLAPG